VRKPEFIYVTYIETTPEKLWEALTDGDFTERYWFGVRLRSEWKAGSSFEMVRTNGTVSDAGKVSNTIRRDGWLTRLSTCRTSTKANCPRWRRS